VAFLIDPPPWFVFPILVIGLLLIWWDMRRANAVAPKLLAHLGAERASNQKDETTRRSSANQVPHLAQEFEKAARAILTAFERLSHTVAEGTQNDDEGVRLQTGINDAVWGLRAKTKELLDQPEMSAGRAPEMRKAVETVYEVVATILNQKAGSLQTLETAISDLLRAQRNLESSTTPGVRRFTDTGDSDLHRLNIDD
jgi:hypothetical protein